LVSGRYSDSEKIYAGGAGWFRECGSGSVAVIESGRMDDHDRAVSLHKCRPGPLTCDRALIASQASAAAAAAAADVTSEDDDAVES